MCDKIIGLKRQRDFSHEWTITKIKHFENEFGGGHSDESASEIKFQRTALFNSSKDSYQVVIQIHSENSDGNSIPTRTQKA